MHTISLLQFVVLLRTHVYFLVAAHSLGRVQISTERVWLASAHTLWRMIGTDIKASIQLLVLVLRLHVMVQA